MSDAHLSYLAVQLAAECRRHPGTEDEVIRLEFERLARFGYSTQDLELVEQKIRELLAENNGQQESPPQA
ncbi:MAG TPA: hypothetical protein VHZ24_23125 [Pirellulales bacterium]|jgi:hypothetical protein|nr:hypothetical protein [Pirellulales bacterium]